MKIDVGRKWLLLAAAPLIGCWSLRGDSTSVEPAIAGILDSYCLDCHSGGDPSGDLDLEAVSGDFLDRTTAATWIEVRDMVNLGEMPPEDEPALPIEKLEILTQWIGSELRGAELRKTSSEGRVPMRRMNRDEYTYTVEDLLDLKFPTGESPLDFLPPEGSAEGFDKLSAALPLDPSLMRLYYDMARRIAERALVDGPPEYPTETMRLEFEDISESRAIGYLVTRLGMNPSPGGIELLEGKTRSWGMLRYPGRNDNNFAPVSGFYRFRLRVGAAPGADGEWPRLELVHNHPDDAMRRVMALEVRAPWDDPQIYTVTLPRDSLGSEIGVEIVNGSRLYMSQRPGEHFFRRNREVGEQGDFEETIRLAGRKIAEGWGGDRSTPNPEKLDRSQFPRLFLDYLEVEGPLYDQWPPKSHTGLLFRGEDPRGAPMAYAREVFARFLPKAWRRPIDDEELDPILGVVEAELGRGGDFLSAIREGLVATLVSPNFLYLVEPTTEEAPGALDAYEVASRLSYFLWSSLPDSELTQLARSGALKAQETLEAQVDRMLADPKIDRFVNGFARQWLRVDTFLAFAPDSNVYRDFDSDLGESMVQEPLKFFRLILQDDLSIVNFIDSEFLVVNERLAEHYGLPWDKEEASEFQRVTVPETSPRGGLLAMAGVSLAGSDGARTKPVSRAVYVREVLFNDPPDPPPPNAGEIEPNIQGENLTVRERLMQHQQIESCAACHRRLDPYGLALENFNVIGHWRTKQDGEGFRGARAPEIDASGRLPSGTAFADFEAFRGALMSQGDRLRRALAERLFVYALGRPLWPSDDPAISAAVERMRGEGDTLRALIKSVVTSQQFLEP